MLRLTWLNCSANTSSWAFSSFITRAIYLNDVGRNREDYLEQRAFDCPFEDRIDDENLEIGEIRGHTQNDE